MRDIFTTTLRYKIRFDLLGAWQRTLQAIMTIAIGAFAVGTILGAYQGVITRHRAQLGSRRPRPPSACVSSRAPTATWWTAWPLAPTSARSKARWNTPSSGARPLTHRGRRRRWSLARTTPIRSSRSCPSTPATGPSGVRWPSNAATPSPSATEVELNIDDHIVTAPIDGVVYNRVTLPASLGGTPIFYTTRRHFAELTGQDRFQFIYATVPDYTPERAAAAAAALQADLKDQGLTVIPASPTAPTPSTRRTAGRTTSSAASAS